MPTRLNLFIAGVEKCGTTALADWFISNGLAEYRVPGVKEPYSYARACASQGTDAGEQRSGVLLDASVGYAFNPAAISRMPKTDTRIIVCLRNHFDRCYSVYSSWRVIAERGPDAARLLETIPVGSAAQYYGVPLDDRQSFLLNVLREMGVQYYPADQHSAVDNEILEQARLIAGQSFTERVNYETARFLNRGTFPFFSVLGSGFYSQALRNLLTEFEPQQIVLVTLDQLNDQSRRHDFAEAVLGRETIPRRLAPLGRLNATAQLRIAKEKPDFSRSEWDMLRECFRQDISGFEEIVVTRGLSTEFVSFDSLRHFLGRYRRTA